MISEQTTPFVPHPEDRSGYLAGVSIVAAILAADCLFDEDVPMNGEQFRKQLAELIRSKVSPSQCENLIAVLNECAKDESWTGGVRRW